MKPQVPQLSIAQLRQLRNDFEGAAKNDPQEVLIDNSEFIRRFKISRRTAYNWRRKKLLPYIAIEEKVYYRLSEIRRFIDRNERKLSPGQDPEASSPVGNPEAPP